MDLRTSAICVSQAAFLIAIMLLACYLMSEWQSDNERTLQVLALYLAFPATFILVTSHCEACFLSLCLASILLMKKGRFMWAFAAAYCAALTRVHGIALIAALFVQGWQQRAGLKSFLPAAGGCAGLFTFLAICKYQFGDFLYYMTAKKYFGMKTVSDFPDTLVSRLDKFSSTKDMSHFIGFLEAGLFEALIVALFLLWHKRKYPELTFLGVCLALSVFGGSTWGLPRYLTFFYPVAGLISKVRIPASVTGISIFILALVQVFYLILYICWIDFP
jgi:hypothetical protein